MKRVYWRPRAVSRTVLVLLAALSLGSLTGVELLKTKTGQRHLEEKLEAARRAQEAMDRLKQERTARGLEIDPETDPAETGLIGLLWTPVTSDAGVLSAKQTSCNPNFAAVIVDMLKRAGVNQGDVVAVGVSGSFPALNACVYCAMETLKVRPVIVASAAASEWGANIPGFLWLDMEDALARDGLIHARAVAASIGGYEDQGKGMSEEGRKLLAETIAKYKLRFIEADTFSHSIEQRMKIYQERAQGFPVKAYINVGGGTVSVGRSLGKKLYEPGLNPRPPRGADRVDSVMTRFSREGVPVIHLTQIEELARRNGLPIAPSTPPAVGVGSIFVREQYNPWLVGGALVLIFLSLHAFLLTDLGFRLLRGTARKDVSPPEPMV